MRLNKSSATNIFIALAIASLVIILSGHGFFKKLKNDNLDFLFRLRGNISSNQNIKFIEIDDHDISRIGQWPWERRWYGQITDALKTLGAKSIYFDIFFLEPSAQEENDRIFGEAIKDAGNVYFPLVFQGSFMDAKKACYPIGACSEYARGVEGANYDLDTDGKLRKLPLYFQDGQKVYPHIALRIAMDRLGMGIKEIRPDSLILSGKKEDIAIPLVDKNKVIINWNGRWEKSFQHHSFLNVLDMGKGASIVKKGGKEYKPFADSICIVTVTATGVCDNRPVPMEPIYPAIGAIATVIGNILDRSFIKTPPFWVDWLLIYVFALLAIAFVSTEKLLQRMPYIVAIAAIFFFAVFKFFQHNIWIDFTAPAVSLFSSYLSVATLCSIQAARERKRLLELSATDELTGLYNIRYFKMALKNEVFMLKREPNRQFSVIMTDIDHFKKFNDTYGHAVGDLVLKEVASALRSSVRSSDVVARYGGEEMIVLLRHTSFENAMILAEKLRANVEKREVKDERNTYSVTISAGVSVSRPGSDDADKIIKRADDGLYKAKEAGRNRVESIP